MGQIVMTEPVELCLFNIERRMPNTFCREGERIYDIDLYLGTFGCPGYVHGLLTVYRNRWKASKWPRNWWVMTITWLKTNMNKGDFHWTAGGQCTKKKWDTALGEQQEKKGVIRRFKIQMKALILKPFRSGEAIEWDARMLHNIHKSCNN